MRIDKIALRAFGRFDNHIIDLSEGDFGLHIIYGPNEAGKSTALRGITDWLFGFPRSTADNYKHGNTKLRVGGVLRDSDGNTLAALRRKGLSNTLRDLDDKELIPDGSLSSFLGNISREHFCNMFGIDQMRLRQGGETLIQNRGDLGESLFAGASGLNQLRTVQKIFDERISSLFVARTTGGELGKNLKKYQELESKQRSESVTVGKWQELLAQKTDATNRKVKLEDELEQAQKNSLELRRIQENLETVALWKEVNECWDLCKDYILLEEDFGITTNSLLARQSQLKVELALLRKAQDDNQRNLDVIPASLELCRFADALEELKNQESIYRANYRNLPKHQTDSELLQAELGRLCDEIALSADAIHIDMLRKAFARRSVIEKLIQERNELESSIAQSRIQFNSKKVEVDSLKNTLNGLMVAPNLMGLEARIKQIRKDNSHSRVQDLKSSILKDEEDWSVKITHPSLLGVSLEKILNCKSPDESDIRLFEEQESEIRHKRSKCKDDVDEENLKLVEISTKLSRLEIVGRIPTTEELNEVRLLRDQAWGLVQKRWINNVPDTAVEESFLLSLNGPENVASALDKLISDADTLADVLRDDATKVAEKIAYQNDIALCKNRLEVLQSRLDACDAEAEEWRERWFAAWAPLGISEQQLKSPKQMMNWLSVKAELVALHSRLERQRADLIECQAKEQSLRQELSDTLRASGVDWIPATCGLDELLEIGDRFLKEQAKVQQAIETNRSMLKLAEDQLKNYSLEIDLDTEKRKTWAASWQDEMRLLQLPEATDCSEARRVLDVYSDILGKLEQLKSVEHDIDRMKNENSAFLSELRNLQVSFGDQEVVPDDGTSPRAKLSNLDARVSQDLNHSRLREEISEKLKLGESGILKVSEELKDVESKLNSCLSKTNKDSFELLAIAAEESTQRKKVQQRVEDLRGVLRSQAPGGDIEAFVEAVTAASMDIDGLQLKQEKLQESIESLKTSFRVANESALEADFQMNQLRQKDSGLQASFERELVASEIESQFKDLVVARLCAKALQDGVERFQELNQAPILRHASQYFQEMTNGRYDELQVDWENDKPIIVAASEDDDSKLKVECMSDGTRDQLYLALRLASLQEWLEHHPPLPFIVDDILIHFDDNRAKATLKSLARLSNKMQVVFFTHNQHLVDLASDCLPSGQLFVHEL